MSLLRELGYTDVRHYAGGLAEWLEHEPSVDGGFNAGATTAPVIVDLRSDRRPARGGRRFSAASLSSRFVDALSEQSIGGLFGQYAAWIRAFNRKGRGRAFALSNCWTPSRTCER